jgi:hypothetical protein
MTAAASKKMVNQSFLDQIDDEDVLAAILKLRRRGTKQPEPELLSEKDKDPVDPVLHRLQRRHSAKLEAEQRSREKRTRVKSEYMDELDDDDVFAALQAMRHKMPPEMKLRYKDIDLKQKKREEPPLVEKPHLILPPSLRKPSASEGEDGRTLDSLEEAPTIGSFNTILEQTQGSVTSFEQVASLSENNSEQVATRKVYDAPEYDMSVETDEITFKQLAKKESPTQAVEQESESPDFESEELYEWKVISVEPRTEAPDSALLQ